MAMRMVRSKTLWTEAEEEELAAAGALEAAEAALVAEAEAEAEEMVVVAEAEAEEMVVVAEAEAEEMVVVAEDELEAAADVTDGAGLPSAAAWKAAKELGPLSTALMDITMPD